MFRLAFLGILLICLVYGAAADTCDPRGGFALRSPDQKCPDDAPVECSNGLQIRCCASGLVCNEDDDRYCCESGVDCKSDVDAAPQCGDPNWILFAGWCCQKGYYGFTVHGDGGGGVGCFENGSPIGTGAETDIAVETSPSALGSCLSSTTGTTTSTSVTSSSSTSATGDDASLVMSSPSNRGVLSGGAIAGIVIAGVFGLSLVGLGCWCIGRRWHNSKNVNSDPSHHPDLATPLNLQPLAQAGPFASPETRHTHELSTPPYKDRPVELQPSRTYHELGN